MADFLSPEEVAYRARFGQNTLQSGQQQAANPRHWVQALAGALQMGLGGHYGANAAYQEKEGKASANRMLADALMGGVAPKDVAARMMGNPWSADQGQRIAMQELDPMTGLNRQKAQLGIERLKADAALDPLRRQKLELELNAARTAQDQQRQLTEMLFGGAPKEAQPQPAMAPSVGSSSQMTPREMLAAQPPDVQAAFRTLWMAGDRKGAMELLTRRDPGRDAINKEAFKADLKTVGDYRTASDDANSLTGKLDRLEAARSQTTREGPVSNYLPSFSAAAQQVDSAATEIQLEFTKQTKGAITEREMALFANATPGWQMTDKAAQPVIDAMRAAAERTKERAKFYDAWMRGRHSLEGAPEAWDSFVRNNPILTQGKDGALEVNKKNVGNWRSYLNGASPAQASSPQLPPGFTLEVVE